MSLILCLVILSWRHIGIYTCGGKNQNYVFCIIFSYIYASSYYNFYYDYIKDFITKKIIVIFDEFGTYALSHIQRKIAHFSFFIYQPFIHLLYILMPPKHVAILFTRSCQYSAKVLNI